MMSLKDKTPAERRAAIKNNMAELKKWASDNNLPAGYLGGLGRGMGHGMGGHMMGGHGADDI
jgi:hypothetical protein